ncbi:MAG: hypothetical protein ACR2P0_08995 [Acidimicrobiales bacterium]
MSLTTSCPAGQGRTSAGPVNLGDDDAAVAAVVDRAEKRLGEVIEFPAENGVD